ncbi:MAG: DUF2270 domain-containing protein [Bradyrhizobium sp.]|nr:MAG: DUF2270 domain-containing protein [Bradyrhizobium sp.]
MKEGSLQLGSDGKQTVRLMSPSSSAECVNLFVHFYRGEMGRALSWRDRLDRTSNWAMTAAAAMLSVSLSSPNSHHAVLIFAMPIMALLLAIESRRYRFFDVYRNRIRTLERNYYAPLFSVDVEAEEADWKTRLSEDLRRPAFSVSMSQAISRRLRRTYCWIFLILLAAWLLKTLMVLQFETSQHRVVASFEAWLAELAIGPLNGGFTLLGVTTFYTWIAYATLSNRQIAGELSIGDVHV